MEEQNATCNTGSSHSTILDKLREEYSNFTSVDERCEAASIGPSKPRFSMQIRTSKPKLLPRILATRTESTQSNATTAKKPRLYELSDDFNTDYSMEEYILRINCKQNSDSASNQKFLENEMFVSSGFKHSSAQPNDQIKQSNIAHKRTNLTNGDHIEDRTFQSTIADIDTYKNDNLIHVNRLVNNNNEVFPIHDYMNKIHSVTKDEIGRNSHEINTKDEMHKNGISDAECDVSKRTNFHTPKEDCPTSFTSVHMHNNVVTGKSKLTRQGYDANTSITDNSIHNKSVLPSHENCNDVTGKTPERPEPEVKRQTDRVSCDVTRQAKVVARRRRTSSSSCSCDSCASDGESSGSSSCDSSSDSDTSSATSITSSAESVTSSRNARKCSISIAKTSHGQMTANRSTEGRNAQNKESYSSKDQSKGENLNESSEKDEPIVSPDSAATPGHLTELCGLATSPVSSASLSADESYRMIPAALPPTTRGAQQQQGASTTKPIKMYLKSATAKVLESQRSLDAQEESEKEGSTEPQTAKPCKSFQQSSSCAEVSTDVEKTIKTDAIIAKHGIDRKSRKSESKSVSTSTKRKDTRDRSRPRHRDKSRSRKRSRSRSRRTSRSRSSRDKTSGQSRRGSERRREERRSTRGGDSATRDRRATESRARQNTEKSDRNGNRKRDSSSKVKVDPFGTLIVMPDQRQPAGYCFVEFKDQTTATRALLKLNGKGIPGSKPHRLFKLNQANYGRDHLNIPEYSLYVGELSQDVDDLALFNTFNKRYKSVRAAKVVTQLDNTDRSKGYGFVRFTSESEQQLALIEMQYFKGLGTRPLRVSLAVPKKSASQSASSYSQVAPPPAPEVYNQYNYYHQTPQYYSQYNQQPGSQYWGDYTTNYYAYAPGAEYSQEQYPQPPAENTYDPEDEVLEDPNLELDVEKANKEFMERSEELYVALEGSRWHPIDNVLCTLSST